MSAHVRATQGQRLNGEFYPQTSINQHFYALLAQQICSPANEAQVAFGTLGATVEAPF
jgi:hypothetical protein